MIQPEPWRTELRAHLEAARAADDPEAVHELRVATRRLSSWLRLARIRVLRDDLAWLRAVAGAVRDADVVIAMDLDPALTAWLREERIARRRALVAALGSERIAALLVALDGLPGLPRSEARAGVTRLARRALVRGRALEERPDDVEAFHALRRAVRSLRYGLEWLDDKTRAFRAFQDVSGAAADRALALRTIALSPEPERLAGRRAALEREFAEHRARTVAAWRELREAVADLR